MCEELEASSVIDEIKRNKNEKEELRSALTNLVTLYTEYTHFIYELLQNAEDVQASKVMFRLYRDRLEVLHDGRPFTKGNLEGICSVGRSFKGDELNPIGKFGIGFKSVFTICTEVFLSCSPENWSGRDKDAPFLKNLNARIFDYVDITYLSAYERCEPGYTTHFRFPFAVGEKPLAYRTFDAIFDALADKLKRLDATTLLFLRHIQNVSYRIEDNGESAPIEGTYGLTREHLPLPTGLSAVKGDSLVEVTARGSIPRSDDEATSFLVFSRPYRSDEGFRTMDIAIPVKIDDEKSGGARYTICEARGASQTKTFVYFPTDQKSSLPFIVQAPFRTPPTRATVAPDSQGNKTLVEGLAQLYRDLVLALSHMGCDTLNFLSKLPYKEDSFSETELFYPFYVHTVKLFREDPILPCEYGGYVDAAHACISRTKELVKCFDDTALNELPGCSDMHWLTTRIPTSENKESSPFYHFLICAREEKGGKDLGGVDITDLRPQDVCRKLLDSKDFLVKRDDAWLKAFYEVLSTLPTQFSPTEKENALCAYPLFKTTKGTIVAAYMAKQGKLIQNLYLSGDQAFKGDVLDPVFLGSEKLQKFFTDTLKLGKPDEYDVFVAEIKDRYGAIDRAKGVSDEQYREDLLKALRFLKDNNRAEILRTIIPNLYFIRGYWEDGNPMLLNCANCNAPLVPVTEDGRDIKAFLSGLKCIHPFIDLDFYQQAAVTYNELRLLGVATDIVVNDDVIEWSERNNGLRGAGFKCTVSPATPEFRRKLDILGLPEALAYIAQHAGSEEAKRKSRFILHTLSRHASKLTGKYRKKVGPEKTGVATVIETLTETASGWLLNRQNLWCKPEEIGNEDELSEFYGQQPLDARVYECLGIQLGTRNKRVRALNGIKEEDLKEILRPICKAYGIDASIEDVLSTIYDDRLEAMGAGVALSLQPNFPTQPVKRWPALRTHVKENYDEAVEVKHEQVLRMVRTSKDDGARDSYVQSHYTTDKGESFCQLCHRPKRYVETIQIETSPKRELPVMNLQLCPECAARFKSLRNQRSTYLAFAERLCEQSEDGINKAENKVVAIPLTEHDEVWFTQTHMAEIWVTLQEMGAAWKEVFEDPKRERPDA